MSKLDQLRALGDARRRRQAKPNAFEDAARGRDPVTPKSKTRVRKPAAPAAMPVASPVAANPPAQTLKPGRPKIAGPRPWDALGMSKRTYYRRKAEGTLP